jgi:hypothetical protein
MEVDPVDMCGAAQDWRREGAWSGQGQPAQLLLARHGWGSKGDGEHDAAIAARTTVANTCFSTSCPLVPNVPVN